MPDAHTRVYEVISAALVADGLLEDAHLLGNRQSPAPLRVGGFRMWPLGVENLGGWRLGVGTRRVEETIVVMISHPMDAQQENSWLAARLAAESAIKAVEGCGLQEVKWESLDSGLDDSGNIIEHDLTFTVAYDLVG